MFISSYIFLSVKVMIFIYIEDKRGGKVGNLVTSMCFI